MILKERFMKENQNINKINYELDLYKNGCIGLFFVFIITLFISFNFVFESKVYAAGEFKVTVSGTSGAFSNLAAAITKVSRVCA